MTSHELCEAITDPDLNTWGNNETTPPNEIGDICADATVHPPIKLGSYLVQTEWSNSRFACVISPFRFSPGITINAVDSTPEPVAACEFKQKLILFWKANDASNSIYFSPSSNGRDWPNGQKINAADSTPKALTACAYFDKLYLFWKANDSSNAIYVTLAADGKTWQPSRRINRDDSTSSPPAACVFNNQLYLFWRANDSSQAIYFSVSDDGLTWPRGRMINRIDSTPQAPAACVFGHNPPQLYLFWCSATTDGAIYVSASPDGQWNTGIAWRNGRKINEVDSTSFSPAVCVFRDELYVFWRANDPSDTLYVSFTPESAGLSWPPGIKVNDRDRSPRAPRCCTYDDHELFLFWKSDDASNLIYRNERIVL